MRCRGHRRPVDGQGGRLGPGPAALRRGAARCTASAGPPSGRSATCSTAISRLGKAGRTRWLGRRPHNRGVAMNPVDHPMGGGEGRSSGGRHPCSPWGKKTKGLRTRNNKRTDKMIVRRRGEAIRDKMAQIDQKGSVHRRPPAEEGARSDQGPEQEGDQDLVAAIDDPARDGRADLRGAPGQEVHPGLRDREHGRSQAG